MHTIHGSSHTIQGNPCAMISTETLRTLGSALQASSWMSRPRLSLTEVRYIEDYLRSLPKHDPSKAGDDEFDIIACVESLVFSGILCPVCLVLQGPQWAHHGSCGRLTNIVENVRGAQTRTSVMLGTGFERVTFILWNEGDASFLYTADL